MQTIFSATLIYPYAEEPVVHLALSQEENLRRLVDNHLDDAMDDWEGHLILTEENVREGLEAHGMRVWFEEHWVPEV